MLMTMVNTVVKVALICLHLLHMPLPGVRSQTEVYVKEGDMVVLRCSRSRKYYQNGASLKWTSHTSINGSSAEQRQMGVLIHEESLLILSASLNHQGKYSCSVGNVSSQFWLMVTTEEEIYDYQCDENNSCELNCPIKKVQFPNVTVWEKVLVHNVELLADDDVCSEDCISSTLNFKRFPKFPLMQEGDLPRRTYHFNSVKKSDSGLYTCITSYLYHGQIYNMTSTLNLTVLPNDKIWKTAAITSPQANDTIYVDLGSPAVIDCKAVTYFDLDMLYWFIGVDYASNNDSLPIYYNDTSNVTSEGTRRTASLVIKKVSREDLARNYTCKLDLEDQRSVSVTITLKQKPPPPSPSYLSLALSIICTVVVMVVAAVIYVKFKIKIILFLRDSLGCHRSSPDGKRYDAFLMSYKSDTDAGLNEHDKKWITSVLEEKFGYSLCLDDRDVSPGRAVAEAVLDCIEQSRTVLLVPSSSEPCLGSGLLSAIHEALVERQSHLVFIKTEAAGVARSGSTNEALQLLCEARDCVTWKGMSSMSTSSSFWSQLRYYLPAPHHSPKIRLLPQKNQDVYTSLSI